MDRSQTEIRNLKAQIALMIQDLKQARARITELEQENIILNKKIVEIQHEVVISPPILEEKVFEEKAQLFEIIMKKNVDEKEEEKDEEEKKHDNESTSEEEIKINLKPVSKGTYKEDVYDFSQVVRKYHQK